MKRGKLVVMALAMFGVLWLVGCGMCGTADVGAEERPIAKRARNPCEATEVARHEQLYPIKGFGGNAVRLEKMAPKEIRANEVFDYQIKVTNVTDRALSNVVVKDVIPANLKFTRSDPKLSEMKRGQATWDLGSLEAKQSKMITVTAMAEGKGEITSCADVFYDSPLCAEMQIVEPKLKLAKSAPTEMLTCDRMALEYILTNNGTGYACDVTVRDMLAEGLVTAEGEKFISFTVDALEPGKSMEFKKMVDISKAGTYSSKAVAISGIHGTAESNMTTTIVSQPILSLSETGPRNQYIGRSMTYEFVVTNEGDGIAKNTEIVAMVPGHAEFRSASNGGNFTHFSPGKVVWKIGALEPGASRKVSMSLRTAKTGMLEIEANAKAYCAEGVSAVGETSITGISAILLEVIDHSDPIEIGQNETYIVSVTNQGSMADTNIAITCMLEKDMQYVSSTGPTEAFVSGRELVFAPLASLAPKAEAQWRINVKALDSGDMRFKAIMNSDQLTRPVEETEATTFYE